MQRFVVLLCGLLLPVFLYASQEVQIKKNTVHVDVIGKSPIPCALRNMLDEVAMRSQGSVCIHQKKHLILKHLANGHKSKMSCRIRMLANCDSSYIQVNPENIVCMHGKMFAQLEGRQVPLPLLFANKHGSLMMSKKMLAKWELRDAFQCPSCGWIGISRKGSSCPVCRRHFFVEADRVIYLDD